ncbi:hypothetical protein GCM10010199_51940 [Dactylosporangium roseum]
MPARPPPRRPTGVRTASTMNASDKVMPDTLPSERLVGKVSGMEPWPPARLPDPARAGGGGKVLKTTLRSR